MRTSKGVAPVREAEGGGDARFVGTPDKDSRGSYPKAKEGEFEGMSPDFFMRNWAFGCPKCNRIGYYVERGCYFCGYSDWEVFREYRLSPTTPKKIKKQESPNFKYLRGKIKK